MDQDEARAMKDRHSRDEAEMRRSQQEAAGSSHAPVERYAQHGAQPGPSAWGADAEALVGEYERTLADERSAWDRLKTNEHAAAFAAAWDEWRAAVEERDKATRLLINASLNAG